MITHHLKMPKQGRPARYRKWNLSHGHVIYWCNVASDTDSHAVEEANPSQGAWYSQKLMLILRWKNSLGGDQWHRIQWRYSTKHKTKGKYAEELRLVLERLITKVKGLELVPKTPIKHSLSLSSASVPDNVKFLCQWVLIKFKRSSFIIPSKEFSSWMYQSIFYFNARMILPKNPLSICSI